MKLIVAGSRSITDYETVRRAIAASGFWHAYRKRLEIVSGMANGVDKLAVEFARRNGLKWHERPADWSNLDVPGAVIRRNRAGQLYNLRAGFARNISMGEESQALCAVWDGESGGTKQMIEWAYEHYVDGNVYVHNLKEQT
jgi:hypothetical protein